MYFKMKFDIISAKGEILPGKPLGPGADSTLTYSRAPSCITGPGGPAGPGALE